MSGATADSTGWATWADAAGSGSAGPAGASGGSADLFVTPGVAPVQGPVAPTGSVEGTAVGLGLGAAPTTRAEGAFTVPPASAPATPPHRPAPVPAAEEAVGVGSESPELPSASRNFLAKAALVTAGLSVAGALLGLVRDQALARLFGAGSDTDAFLVAWTVPEFAATLLIEDGLAFALIPAFSMALARRAQGVPGDPVRALVAGTLPRLALAFVAVGALLAGIAPQVVEVLAPGLPDPALAVDCTRITATCVVSFGLAGYCSAALRAHRRYLAPAAIYVAYNVGIITGMLVLGGQWGVRAAAAGVAVGGCLMVVVQVPALLRQLRKKTAGGARNEDEARPLDTALLATVLLFALCRQSQVLVERFLASSLPSGAISHLNYAQKVAQMPMILSVMVCTVTFPVVARALADGDVERAKGRVERDLALAASIVLLGTAAVVACAPQIIGLLFQRGAFTASDTAATAGVMRVYALGLLGQTLTGVLARSYFSAGRGAWYPVGAMATGIAVTSAAGALAVGPWGVYGIAAANAAGITVTALVLLAGMGPRSVPVHLPTVIGQLAAPVVAAVAATAAGALVAARLDGAPLAGLAVGGLTVTGVFLAAGRALGAQGVVHALRFAGSVTRRLPYVRSR
ncbi:murein biosynthesis integral membrane protein MurJ [Streptomyces sp. CAI-85]|uniref:murein biosynthesis integral membrane protein MurJ n=1 Tax=Streptomyces sp. CAI-85 TaxID=1472662 RepID=UPI00158733DD|nr:lipid II flippase MurJ [Streptomyces sp. CAI-85]NUV59865.1 murein biosynthesis protein MurJ [Streptomyces sp. CAI-85]